MFRIRTTLRAGVLALALLGCRDATGPSLDELVGEYILMTIDGDPLPVIVDQIEDDIAEVTAGLLTLDDNQNFTDATSLRFTISGEVTTSIETATGTWSVASNGTTVTFSPSDASGNYVMTWNGEDQLTQIFDGFTLVYLRSDAVALRTPRP